MGRFSLFPLLLLGGEVILFLENNIFALIEQLSAFIHACLSLLLLLLFRLTVVVMYLMPVIFFSPFSPDQNSTFPCFWVIVNSIWCVIIISYFRY